jgi:peptidoglycan hydrolase-like protein with peptidoglycan-binding domain
VKRRKTAVAAVTLVAVGCGGAAMATAMTGGDGGAPGARNLPAATGTVTRGDLIDTETVDGTLGYGDERALVGAASGTVTWIAGVGATVKRGGRLYDLNNEPVTLMYGDEPMYRTLSEGTSDGPDVKQLERNLDALGYGAGVTVDDHFTAATASAVEKWQQDRGLEQTGAVDGAQVIFAPGAVRITERKAELGGRTVAGKPVFEVTGTERQIRVDLDTDDQQLARKGAAVTVELPGGKTASGRITKVGTVAVTKKPGSSSSSTESTIEVDIALDDPKDAGRLDKAPVSVELQSERHENVLSVPVEALLALREGGYGVQVVRDGRADVVPVRTGLYAQGRVEVGGPGLAPGVKVGVPGK